MILYATAHKAQHAFPAPVQEFLHEQLRDIRDAAQHYRRKCNFALLAAVTHKRFGYPFQRHSIYGFAPRYGYDYQRPGENGKVYVRFEMPGPGLLLQHDASRHCWVPALGGSHSCS